MATSALQRARTSACEGGGELRGGRWPRTHSRANHHDNHKCPGPSPSYFVQMSCTDAACIVGCENVTLPTGQCLLTTSGVSAIVTCGAETLTEEVFFTSTHCSGPSVRSSVPLNKCNRLLRGSVEFFCGSSSSGRLADVDRQRRYQPYHSRHRRL
ncbi:cysteine proteinase [Trypanosoma cruzi]|nr:cysteine proteinase [Trypanosoma cruzi]